MSAVPAFLNDFPDSFSPMVVKELRQGLRARVFTGTLLGLHAVLIVATLISTAASGAADTRWLYEGVATLVLCLVLPLRAVNALADEVKHQTLEMLRLTRLSPLRIATGKWTALALQMLLVAVSLLPYSVARYLLGGLELGTEVMLLGGRLLVGLVLAAAFLAVSTLRQQWMRSLFIMLPVMFGSFGVVSIFISMTLGGSSSFGLRFYGPSGMVAILVVALWAIFAFLSLAASRIAAPAEPLSRLKRTVHLLAMLVPVVACQVTHEKAALLGIIPILVLMALDALAEPINPVPIAYVPFYRRGILGRLVMPLLAPGWVTGFWLSILGVGLGCWALHGAGASDAVPYFLLSACTVWMACVIVQCLPSMRRAEDPLVMLISTLLVIGVLMGVLGSASVAYWKLGGKEPWLMAVLPPTAMVSASSFRSVQERENFLQTALLFASVWPFFLGILSLLAWRSLADTRKQAREMAAGPG